MGDMTNDKGQLALQDRLMQLIADEVEIVRALDASDRSDANPSRSQFGADRHPRRDRRPR